MSALLTAGALTGKTWRRSTKSGAAGHCVEIAEHGTGVVVRNSNDPAAGGLAFTRPELGAFVAGVKAGEFDDLI